MNRERKIRTPVTLFASIESAQHDALRKIAFDQRRSLADIVREALGVFLAGQKTRNTTTPRAGSRAARAK